MTREARPADLLETIVAATRRIVDVRREREPLAALSRRAEAVEARPGRFRSALVAKPTLTSYGVIAECKRRSPSKGVLRRDYDPAAIAAAYERAGAAAVSVLTEPTFFDGSLEHLADVRSAVGIPLLRKDFIVSEYQLLETRAAGVDAVLLIVAALGPRELSDLMQQAARVGLDVLVEVHNADELARAIDAGASVIGVNNRNLRTLEIDVRVSEEIVARIPRAVVAVSESGLRSAADLARLSSLGYRAFLVGERLMSEPDPGQALREILEA